MLVNGIPLVVVIFGLVEFIKSSGLTGKWLTLLSLVLGLLFGIVYQIYSLGLPVIFATWFEYVVFGLALGLVASGFYDFANARFPKK